jgi:geranylgeranylglycerol-phosphate geranylgeranyltransferase
MEQPGAPPLELRDAPAEGSPTWAILRLVRVENCVMAGVATLIGSGTTGTAGPAAVGVAGSMAAVMLVLAFGNVANDVADQDSDRLGKAHRPLPSGRVSTSRASGLAVALLVIALFITAVTAPHQLPFVVAMAAVAALYSPFLKRVPLLGNAVFAAQCGAILVFGARAAGDVHRSTVAAALLVAVGILCVEVAKTVEDDDADRAVGTRTVAHLVAVIHQPRLVGGFAAAYVAVWALIWPTAHSPVLFALAAAPALPLLAFAALPPGRRLPSARVARFVVVSKCLWPLALLALAGL